MKIGIPKEIKILEGRIALIPAAAAQLVHEGHEVFIESGAGDASGYSDKDYETAGVTIIKDATTLYGESEMIVKVKEPIEPEFDLLRKDHIVFSFLHLAAEPTLARVLCDKGLTAVGFETVEHDRRLPLLAPMSDIAGRLSVQIGATLLHRPNGGRGILLGGMPSAERGNVVVLGAGTAGGNAIHVAASLGANITVFEHTRPNMDRAHAMGNNVTALPSYKNLIEEHVRNADLVIGAVLITGAKAPKLVTEEMVKQMNPGSVIIDIAVDQGGCIETTRPTNHKEPTFVKHGVIHYGVTNMPGAVPRTASQALSAALTPYVLRLARKDGLNDPEIQSGINVQGGNIIHPVVREALIG
jgi:alanine dehydrogenase